MGVETHSKAVATSKRMDPSYNFNLIAEGFASPCMTFKRDLLYKRASKYMGWR